MSIPALKHKSVPVCRGAVPSDLLKEDRFLLRDDVKDADGVGQSWVLNVLPSDPHMVRIQPAKSEGVHPLAGSTLGRGGSIRKRSLPVSTLCSPMVMSE